MVNVEEKREAIYIGARVSPKFKESVERLAEMLGVDVSGLIRLSLTRLLLKVGLLPEEDKETVEKALLALVEG